MADFLTEAEREFMRTPYSFFITGQEPLYHFLFKPKGTRLTRYPRWRIILDKNRKLALVLMNLENKQVAKLQLFSSGVWKGPSLHGEFIQLLPETNVQIWQTKFSDVKRFVKSMAKTTTPKKMNYRQSVPQRVNWSAYQYDARSKLEKVESELVVGILSKAEIPTKFTANVINQLQQQTISAPVVAFIDQGYQGSYPDAFEDKIRMYADSNIQYIAYTRNWGYGRHVIDAHRQLLENLGYGRACIIQENSILTTDYLESIMQVADLTKQVQGVGSIHLMSDDSGFLNQFELAYKTPSDWFLTKKQWVELRGIVYEYERLYLTGDGYNTRSDKDILNWLHDNLGGLPTKDLSLGGGDGISKRDAFFRATKSSGVELPFFLGQAKNGRFPVFAKFAKGCLSSNKMELRTGAISEVQWS